ncbi:MAG: 4Fe-4S dicluster domain-containing protein [Dehalococcoidia bacterium]|nr:4Fe-4S dicluster domain-containing protein [Dehalococcoidia bacterium]
MARYGMVIDLSKCMGCCGCMMACKVEHTTPPGVSWVRVLNRENGKYPAVSRTIMPVQCNHCKDAACVKVCPTGATSKREDGIVEIDSDKCVGCRYCMMACPFGSRYYYDSEKYYFPGNGPTPFEEIGCRDMQTGVVMKCNFCLEKLEAGVKKGLKPGVDREATPSCVNNCMTKARYFGDLEDPDSEVSQLIRANRGRQVHPEYGTDPSIYYIK